MSIMIYCYVNIVHIAMMSITIDRLKLLVQLNYGGGGGRWTKVVVVVAEVVELCTRVFTQKRIELYNIDRWIEICGCDLGTCQ